MKDSCFLDTNLVVYLFDKTDEVKHRKTKHLLQQLLPETELHISIQVINEFIVIASQKIKNPLSLKEILKRIDFLSGVMNINTLHLTTCSKALELKGKYACSYWDSLIMASALESNCSVLYTEDLQHGQVIEKKLKIINPFAEK